MIKVYKPVGDRICTVGGDTTSKAVICKEVTFVLEGGAK